MKFKIDFPISSWDNLLTYADNLFFIGSCFSENIHQKFRDAKFSCCSNPNGILFNPVSISKAIHSYTTNYQYQESDIFLYQELWHSWQHHSRYSSQDKAAMLDTINTSQQKAHDFLQKTNYLFLTLGSAWVYEKEGEVVANCHKYPSNAFSHRLLTIEECYTALEEMLLNLKKINPAIQIVFTISPVRHLREGIINNNRSKAILIYCVHALIEKYPSIVYFPAYEIVLDELRDYRFFAEDMAHPTSLAVDYIWEILQKTSFHSETLTVLPTILALQKALDHKPFHIHSPSHQKFLSQQYSNYKQLLHSLPWLDWHKEELFFNEYIG